MWWLVALAISDCGSIASRRVRPYVHEFQLNARSTQLRHRRSAQAPPIESLNIDADLPAEYVYAAGIAYKFMIMVYNADVGIPVTIRMSTDVVSVDKG